MYAPREQRLIANPFSLSASLARPSVGLNIDVADVEKWLEAHHRGECQCAIEHISNKPVLWLRATKNRDPFQGQS